MKILFISPRYEGGIGGHAFRVAEKLREQGYDVKLMHVPHIPIKNIKNPSFALFGVIKALLDRQKYDVVEPGEGGYINSQTSMAENLPEVVGQSYFGYMKEGYVLNIEVGGVVRRIEIVSLNDDATVDIVMARAFNLEEGETVLADYDYDDVADIGFTLEGVDLYGKRFSATVTYFGTVPDEIVRED